MRVSIQFDERTRHGQLVGCSARQLFRLRSTESEHRPTLSLPGVVMAFYLTLPSNSSMQFFPDNRASHYFTKLPQEINLSGDYEVGLSEIQFSSSYLNIEDKSCHVRFLETEDETEKACAEIGIIFLPAGLYSSNELFITTLNNLSQKEIGPRANGKPKLKFYFTKASRKASLTIYEKKLRLQFSPKLERVLGMSSLQYDGPGYYPGSYMMDLNEDFKSIYVYCDIVKARPLGDSMSPLLRIVPTAKPNEEIVHLIYEKPHYVPLSRLQFGTLEVLLTTDKGIPISFSSGTTILTLHFRRQRLDL